MSPHTIRAYETDLGQFIGFLADKGISDITTCDSVAIREWMSSMLSSGRIPRTIHRKISSVRAWLSFLRKQGQMKNDPLSKVVLPKMPRKIVKDIPAADLEAMFRNFPWNEEKYGQRDKLILLMLYTTGMRLTELTNLRRRDADLKRMTLSVTGKRNKQRIIPVHPELADAISAYFNASETEFFISTPGGKQAYPVFIYRIVNRYLRLFSSALKTSPHVLRHSFATHMLNNGANLMAIKDLLGHTSLSATQVYTKNSFEKLKAIHKLHPRN